MKKIVLAFVLSIAAPFILTYYGVNLVFGQGLHSYGFGVADYLPLVTFFAFELLLVTVATTTYLVRKNMLNR